MSNIYPINIYEPWQQPFAIFIPHEYLPIQVHNSLTFIFVPTTMNDYGRFRIIQIIHGFKHTKMEHNSNVIIINHNHMNESK